MENTSTSPTITLYSSPISDCSARLRIALNLKRLSYKLITVNLKARSTETADYAALNASQTVPTLCHGDLNITQSLAALKYLDECFPNPNPLLPKDDVAARAKVRTLVAIIATDTHPLLTHRVGRALEEWAPAPGLDVMAWRMHWLRRGLEIFEKEVAGSAGSCCVGDQVTLADVCLVPALWTAVRWEIRLEGEFPTIARVYQGLMAREEFGSARQDPAEEL